MSGSRPNQTKDSHRINPSGPNFGNRSGDLSMALLIDSKSAALLCISTIPATRAVAAMIPSKPANEPLLPGFG